MYPNKYKKITILLGGISKEREVSFVSGQKCYEALKEIGYDVSILDTQRDDWINVLQQDRPDAVLNMLHGRFGEDGIVQGVLEVLQIPYSHSGVAASALAMDKVRTKTLLEAHCLPVPKGFFAKPESLYTQMTHKLSSNALTLPVVVKPIYEGSSMGVLFIHNLESLKYENLPSDILGYDHLMVEEFIAGREFTVSVLDNKPLTVTEIVMPDNFYNYEAKYTQGGAQHIIPADIPKRDFDLMMDYALKAHHILGCKGVTRTDFRYGIGDSPAIFILELNTQPGMTPTSLVPEQAQYFDIDYKTLVAMMVEDATCNR